MDFQNVSYAGTALRGENGGGAGHFIGAHTLTPVPAASALSSSVLPVGRVSGGPVRTAPPDRRDDFGGLLPRYPDSTLAPVAPKAASSLRDLPVQAGFDTSCSTAGASSSRFGPSGGPPSTSLDSALSAASSSLEHDASTESLRLDSADEGLDTLSPALPSIGSKGHPTNCKPCQFVHTPVNCAKGAFCAFCHYKHSWHGRPRPNRDKRKRFRRALEMQLEAQAQSGTSSASNSVRLDEAPGRRSVPGAPLLASSSTTRPATQELPSPSIEAPPSNIFPDDVENAIQRGGTTVLRLSL